MTKVSITAVDAAGNVSAASTVNITWQTTTPPPPATVQRFGVYIGGNAEPTAITSSWKKPPNLYSAYLGWNTVGLPSAMKSAAGKGQAVQVELDTGMIVTWADVAAGKYDTQLKARFALLDALGVPVWVSLCNEADLKVSNGQVIAGQTGAQFIAASNHFATLIRNGGYKHLETMVWFAGSGPVSSFLPDPDLHTHIGWDPYKTGTHPVAETATQTFGGFISKYLTGAWANARRHINETGVVTDKGFDAATCAAFYKSIPAAMDALNIESVIVFWDNSGGKTYTTTDATVIAGLAAAAADII